jgi:hypothetical protein
LLLVPAKRVLAENYPSPLEVVRQLVGGLHWHLLMAGRLVMFL